MVRVNSERSNWASVRASGFHARIVQHEYDHLDGILYTMRMTDFRLFGFNEELNRLVAARDQ